MYIYICMFGRVYEYLRTIVTILTISIHALKAVNIKNKIKEKIVYFTYIREQVIINTSQIISG